MNIVAAVKNIFKKEIHFEARVQKIALTVAVFIVLYLLLVLAGMPVRLHLELGRPSTRTIFASRDIIDYYTTEQLRMSAAEAVPDVFDYNPAALDEAQAVLDQFFDTLAEINTDQQRAEEEKLAALRELLGEEMPDTTLIALLNADSASIAELRRRLTGAVTDVFQQGITLTGLETAKRHLKQEIALFPVSSELKRVSEEIVDPLVEPNMLANLQATVRNREAARQGVEPVLLLRNTLIISEGEPVTEKHLAHLESLGLVRGRYADYQGYIGMFLMLAILFVLVGIYLSIFVKDVYNSVNLLTLLGLISILTLVLIIAATYFSGYSISAAMGVMLITVMFGYKLAVPMNIIFAVMAGLVAEGEFSYMVISLIGGLVAVYALSRVSQRSDLAKAGLYVAAVNAAVILAVFLLKGNISPEYGFFIDLGYGLLAGIGSGLVSSVVAIGLLPYLESGFGVTTAITLLELSDPNRPLLRELLRKAPGTYYHSMMVCNLAEAAAEAVRADSLLARVGACYHDIGKLRRPYFFSENQLSGENPHQKISPNLSALVVGSHVKDGVDLAKKYRLPPLIQDIIRQHHGSGLISFFYQKALESCGPEKVSKDSFRYEGPLPQTKEAAIIMLADAVEAGVRSMAKPAGNRVEALIRRLIKDKLHNGQMDECNLTLKELDQIGDSFVFIMSGIYHSRIEYPEKDLRAEFERNTVR